MSLNMGLPVLFLISTYTKEESEAIGTYSIYSLIFSRLIYFPLHFCILIFTLSKLSFFHFTSAMHAQAGLIGAGPAWSFLTKTIVILYVPPARRCAIESLAENFRVPILVNINQCLLWEIHFLRLILNLECFIATTPGMFNKKAAQK